MGTRKYSINNTSSVTDAIQMLYITSSICENDWISSLHSHDFAEIFYVKAGHGYFVSEGRKYKVEKNNLVVINPMVEHTEFSEKDDPLDYYVLGIENLKLEEDDNFSIISMGNDAIRDCFYHIHSEMRKREEGFEKVCQYYFQIILLNIQRKATVSFSITEPHSGSRECQLIKEYIDANYAEPITLDMLSSRYNLSKYYICHNFNRMYGTSPIAYLNNVRIDTCKDLLATTDHSIHRISEMVGFSSSSYLSQIFRKNVGQTAQMYRKMHKKSAAL